MPWSPPLCPSGRRCRGSGPDPRRRGPTRPAAASSVRAMVVELYHRDAGTGPAVVLLHAFPLSSAMWLAQREALAADFRVITPDLRGFGGSPLGDDEPSLDAVADDVAALLDAKGLDRVVL